MPTFGSKTAGPFRFDSGAAVNRTLPAADGGDGSVTYTIERPGTPNTAATLPCGLAFTGSGRLLAAASTATGKLHPTDCTLRNTRYTLVAADVDGDRATLEFVLAVGSALTFGDTAGPTLAFRTGHLVEFELPAAEGGDGRVDYTLGATPALPNGLGFLRVRRGSNAEQSRTLWGTPGRAHPRTTYTLTAADGDGDTATQTFTLTVADAVPAFGSRTVSAKRYVVHTPVNDVLPAATGGDGTLTYTVAPGLPAGLSFTASPPTIAGTPTEAAVEATYTLTATDANGDRADVGFRLTVAGAPLVTSVDIESTPADADKAYRAGETIEVKVSFDSKLMHVFGNARAVIQAPFLSLRIGAQTRRAMVFTADMTSKTFCYPVQATDEDTDGIGIPRTALSLNGGTKQDRTSGAAAILDLGVHAVTNDANHQVDGDRVGTAPTFASGLPAGLTYTEGRRIDPATSLPAATGGEGTLRYALTGPGAAAMLSLPAGLTYGAPGGTTSGGTPTAGAAAATYTLTATDRDGDADASPTFGPRTWTAQRYRKNVRVTTAVPGGTDLDYVALPAATARCATASPRRCPRA